MSCSDYLALSNLLIAFIGVAFASLAVWEWRSLRATRKEFDRFREELLISAYNHQKAQQRIMSSYQINDIDQRISLVQSAIDIAPDTFNAFNTLGYAYWQKGDLTEAADAFKDAIHHHPTDKAGYFDLARLHLAEKRIDLAKKYLWKAIDIDESSRNDIQHDPQLHKIINP